MEAFQIPGPECLPVITNQYQNDTVFHTGVDFPEPPGITPDSGGTSIMSVHVPGTWHKYAICISRAIFAAIHSSIMHTGSIMCIMYHLMMDAMKSVDGHSALRQDLMTEMWERYCARNGNIVDDDGN